MKIDFPKIQTRLTPGEFEYVTNVIRSAETYSMGPELKRLEDTLAGQVGVAHAVGVNSCTAALELAVMTSGLVENDEVIIPAHTFTATAIPFLRLKAKLVFADIDPETLVMSMDSVRSCMTSKTKAIVPVHLYGLMVDMPKIMELAQRHGLTVIEDCAQSPGAHIHGKAAGSWGDFGCFSFHSQKNIHALGEGGCIVTQDARHYERLLGLRKIGSRPFQNQKKYWVPAMSNIVESVPGKVPYNFALPEPNAAAACCLLKRLEAINDSRRRQARQIQDALADCSELQFQKIPPGYASAHHLLVARYTRPGHHRDELIELLHTRHGIQCVVQYYPLYNYELFQKNGYMEKICPRADDFFNHMISFPFWTDMPEDVVHDLVQSVRAAVMELRT